MSMTRRTPFPALALGLFLFVRPLAAQPAPPPLPATPLPPEVLSLLANEVSGQMAFDNEVRLAGAPWLRARAELSGTLAETRQISDLVRGYGIEHTRIEQYPGEGTASYPVEAELWETEPGRRLVARLGADAALVAGGSVSGEVSGELVYVPPLSPADIERLRAAGTASPYRGKVALMWSHAREEAAAALDAAGVQGVVSFGSLDRYHDPNQVVYGRGAYGKPNLKIGLSVSWRQFSEWLEDVLGGRKVSVRARVAVESLPDRTEAVYSWIPGTEPDAKGVVFTAHLFEGFVKRGANDNMSGCVVQLEILRALHRLIADGRLPQPRRTIYFLWPSEISGTFEFIRRHPGIAGAWSVNVNMDMVGEGLRRNNAVMTMSECPDHLPCYLDGLLRSVMNYVWRTNDVVYLPDSPRGRPGGQYFPLPLVEKNGSNDAFRFFTHRATGGSDHICFNNPSVAVPGVELFTWPDQWYHAVTDTPDKSDPTQMKRIAFIGAAAAWAAANCTDEVLAGLLDAVSGYGYSRVAQRDLPQAFAFLEQGGAASLAAGVARALVQVNAAVDREIGAIRSLEDVYSGSPAARRAVDDRVRQWELYRAALQGQVRAYAGVRAAGQPAQPGGARRAGARPEAAPAGAANRLLAARPAIAEAVRGRLFSLPSHEPYAARLKADPDTLKRLGLTPGLAATVLNYVNGRRTIAAIRDAVAAETGTDLAVEHVAAYLELLRTVGWVVVNP